MYIFLSFSFDKKILMIYMELHIEELDFDDSTEFDNHFEEIPENANNKPLFNKVIKKVHFDETVLTPPLNSHLQSIRPIPKIHAKMTRPAVPPQKPKISYEDILSKMGMLVHDGKLHLMDRSSAEKLGVVQNNQPLPQINRQPNAQISTTPDNSYIYNKYFKSETVSEPQKRRPRTLHEYRMMQVDDFLQRHRIQQIKSTKLVMPTSNINMNGGHPGNMNRLFNFKKK